MGLSKSKTTQTSSPADFAKDALAQGVRNTQDVFTAQQPRLNAMADLAQNAFTTIAPGAFGANSFVSNGQNVATNLAAGKTDYSGNPTLQRLAAGTAMPSSATTANLLNGGYDNPAMGYDAAVSGGRYLGANPGSGLYADTIAGKFLDSNPWVESLAGASADRAQRAVNARFAASGMGEGVSTPYADILSKNVLDAGNSVRYANYDAERSRQLQAAGAADAAFANERGNMDAANARTSSNYQSMIAQILQAAGLADQSQLSSQGQQLTAAQALNSTESQDRAQQLQALGLIPALRDAEYAGVDPALSLLQTSAALPWLGTNAFSNNIDQLSSGYGTQTGTQSGNIFNSLLGAGSAIASAFIKRGS